jgi:cytochrome c oxidase assembly protein subunit 15
VTASPTAARPGLYRYAAFVVVATLILIFAGGLVTSTGSGLAVPDWPLSFGQLFPRMEGGVLYEHGHRMIAAAVGALTVALALWLWRREPRRWVRRLGWVAVAAVIVQGVLGGLTVLLRLPDATSVAHAGLAQGFLCLVFVIAVVTRPGWEAGGQADGQTDRRAGGQTDRRTGGQAVRRTEGQGALRMLALATLVAVYIQILLGAVVRHTGAGLVIPTFPLANGRLWPPIDSSFVAWQMAHRVGALVVTVLVVATAVQLVRRFGAAAPPARAAFALVALLAWQVLLGALTIWKQKAVIPTTLHVVSGSAVLLAALFLALRVMKTWDRGTGGQGDGKDARESAFSVPPSPRPPVPRR